MIEMTLSASEEMLNTNTLEAQTLFKQQKFNEYYDSLILEIDKETVDINRRKSNRRLSPWNPNISRIRIMRYINKELPDCTAIFNPHLRKSQLRTIEKIFNQLYYNNPYPQNGGLRRLEGCKTEKTRMKTISEYITKLSNPDFSLPQLYVYERCTRWGFDILNRISPDEPIDALMRDCDNFILANGLDEKVTVRDFIYQEDTHLLDQRILESVKFIVGHNIFYGNKHPKPLVQDNQMAQKDGSKSQIKEVQRTTSLFEDPTPATPKKRGKSRKY